MSGDAAKARLRAQALDWLKADLNAWTKLLEADQPENRPNIAKSMVEWQQDSALAGIHDTATLAKLPAEEQKAFVQLWADVTALLKKAEDKPK